MAAEQVEAVRPDGAEVEEVVADKGYHSDATLVALDEIGVRSYVSEPERGRRCWQDKKTGETPADEACCAEGTIWEPSAYSRRPRSSSSTPPRGAGGAAFRAPVRDRGAAAGVGARPRECAQAGAHPGGRLQPRTAAAPPDRRRHAPEPAGAGSFGHLRTDRAPDRALGASDGLLGLPMDASGAGRLNRSSPSCLNRSAQRIDFFHGLQGGHIVRFEQPVEVRPQLLEVRDCPDPHPAPHSAPAVGRRHRGAARPCRRTPGRLA